MKIEKLVVGLYEENCYFLIKDNKLIIIDPGDEFGRIDDKIISDKLNLVAILITHAHFDHVGALEQLINKYEVPVYYNNINNEINYINIIDIEEGKYNVDSFRFEVISTKGHRNDMSTFYFYDDNVMFTGDFLFRDTVGRMDLEYASTFDMKKSIEKIKKYPGDIIIYPGHGVTTQLDYEINNNYYF